jgi:hypothetical protein
VPVSETDQALIKYSLLFFVFCATVDLAADELDEQLMLWQHYYNWGHPHSAQNGRTPIDKYVGLSDSTPFSAEIFNLYQSDFERIQDAN